MSQDNLPQELLAKPSKPWLTWVMAGLLVMGVASWWLGPPLMRKGSIFMARHHAAKAVDLMERQEWGQAQAALEKARAWKADDPKVLRALADFLTATQSDPVSTLHYLRLLEVIGQITEADLLRMGQLYVLQSDAANAEATLAKLPAAARERRPALEVLANVQRLQGRAQLAADTLRRALLLDRHDPMCRLRLAMLDQSAAFPEIRDQARQSLWDLTKGKDQAALLALDNLAHDPRLTPTEADQLVAAMEAHPDRTEEVRLAVLSGLLRARPERKKEIVDAEITHMQTVLPEQLLPNLTWLLQEKQPQRIVEFRPRDFFTKSSLLIQAYLQALGDLGRWEEVDKLLSRPAGMPVSPAFIAFWRARATRQIDTDPTRVRQHLSAVYEATGHGRDGATATAAAALAEEAGVWDVAAQLYEGLAEHQPKSRVTMLEKVHQMALRTRDTEAVLRSSDRLLALRPNNQQYVLSDLYLHLVSGVGLEIRRLQIDLGKIPPPASDEDRLCLALAAYRFGDLEELRRHLGTIVDPKTLSPGQRAVHAGLLSISGQVGPAYQIAEQVPTGLLLKEEARFLGRAL
ncbi:hypothetical protein [Brevifollis gellanilyticus]|uniref:Uncharacterized protein n=1 Tax=Brevifollis gellanilyticus TaxID=748831 RepID=A0A512MD60_9BACT|nr:hypothetical protein [Brevifollis gellanilyticus]GEP44675.1 hypothetical protein BGE01nite_39660 [Brevifollis gellanilyticus]